MIKLILVPIFLTCLASQSLAMKSRHETFPQTCEAVWNASVAVAKSEQYRIVSISKDEQVVSLIVGGVWAGERIISLSLAPGVEGGCTVTVQSRFSGLAHADGPDLLERVHMELLGARLGRDSKAFEEYKLCLEHRTYPDWGGKPKCAQNFVRKAEAEKTK
ncbi:MAG TPA: hypothetical protein VK812_13305 [Candidatus Binatus sp.]|jgi:hypothetical protein|nr:hypothetical protein [Candidatus Binatus sp.]